MAGTSPEEFREAADLRSALRRFLRHSEDIARRHGLTPRQYLLLLMIKGAPNGREHSTITELVERLSLTQSTVTELVQRAEEAALVAREASRDDGRVVMVSLTAAGESALAAAFAELGPERELLLQLIRHDQ